MSNSVKKSITYWNMVFRKLTKCAMDGEHYQVQKK